MKTVKQSNPFVLKMAKKIMKVWLAGIFFVLASTASMADNNDPNDTCGLQDLTQYQQYYMDGQGYIQQFPQEVPVQRYEPWTYLDENGYDYTILIKLK